MSKDVEIYYCPIHGDLLAAPRSMRCHEAPEGHEFSRATVPDVAQGGRDDREAVEAVIDVLMGLPVQVRRDTTALAEALVAGLPALSRATAPDAATEVQRAWIAEDRAKLDRADAEAERDAALAAIERVRAWVAENSVFLPRPMAWEVERALDGAPEPEWEYTDSEGDPGPHHLTRFSTDPGTLARRNENRQRMGHEALPIYRRRKAGPWERVEGSRP